MDYLELFRILCILFYACKNFLRTKHYDSALYEKDLWVTILYNSCDGGFCGRDIPLLSPGDIWVGTEHCGTGSALGTDRKLEGQYVSFCFVLCSKVHTGINLGLPWGPEEAV